MCGCVPAFVNLDAQEVALGGADDRARHGAVVGPGREGDALGDLESPSVAMSCTRHTSPSAPQAAGRAACRGRSARRAPVPRLRSSPRGPWPRGRGPRERRAARRPRRPRAAPASRAARRPAPAPRRSRVGVLSLEISPRLKSMLTAAAVASARPPPHGRCRAIVYACLMAENGHHVTIWSDYI